MSALDDFVAAVQALAAGLRDAATDPADQIRLMIALAEFPTVPATGAALPDAAGQAGADLCRRAALTQLARATTAYEASSYDEGLALRDLVCGLLQDEELAASEAGQDATSAAFRALRVAVAIDLTERVANLARLRQVTTRGPTSALALAYRLYGDAGRADELSGYAQARNPVWLPTSFRARDR